MVKGQYMVLYPRSYNKRGQEHLHSVQGVTSEGKEVNVKLRIDDATRLAQGDMVATIAELSRTDRKAKMACIHSEDNGPDNREGVLLFENVKPDSKPGNFISSNAHVLAEHSEKVAPVIGLGRMDIKKDTQSIKKAEKNLRAELARPEDMQNQKRIRQLKSEIENPANYNYRAVIYEYDSAVLINDPNPSALLETMTHAINKNTRSGITGGVLIKSLDEDNRIIEDLCHEHFTMYDIKASAYQSGEEATGVYLRTEGKKLWTSEVKKILVIPLSRYNCGPLGNKDCGKNHDQIISQFFEGDNPLISRVALSLSYFADRDNTLLYKLFPISPQLGRPEKLSSSGRMIDLFQGETGEVINILDSEVIERPVGLFSFGSFPIEELSESVVSIEQSDIQEASDRIEEDLDTREQREEKPEAVESKKEENNELFEIEEGVDIFDEIDDAEDENSEVEAASNIHSDTDLVVSEEETNIDEALEESQDYIEADDYEEVEQPKDIVKSPVQDLDEMLEKKTEEGVEAESEEPLQDPVLEKREKTVEETEVEKTVAITETLYDTSDNSAEKVEEGESFLDVVNELIEDKIINLNNEVETNKDEEISEELPEPAEEVENKALLEEKSQEVESDHDEKPLAETKVNIFAEEKDNSVESYSAKNDKPKKELSGMMAFLQKKRKG